MHSTRVHSKLRGASCLNLDGATTSELREGSSGRVLKPNSGRASPSERVQDTAELIPVEICSDPGSGG